MYIAGNEIGTRSERSLGLRAMNLPSSFVRLPLCIAALLSAAAFATPTLLVENGKLVGADGVSVSGVLYDVRFVDGTCGAVYPGCDGNSVQVETALQPFYGQPDLALQASQALIDSVFVDGPLGNFDTNPSAVFGCAELDVNGCGYFTPYGYAVHPILFQGWLIGSNSHNGPLEDAAWNGASIGFRTEHPRWAKWSLSDVPLEVPEPPTYALMLAALGGLGFVSRRRKY